MLDSIVCPTGCSDALPPVLFDKCAPETRLSEYIAVAVGLGSAAPFADWSSPTEWATRLDQAATTGDKIRLMTIRGNKPAPTETKQTLTGNRTRTTARHHVINFMIDEVNDTNYDFVRTLECGGLQFRVWPITDDGKEIQGGNDGILVSINASFIYDEGVGVLQKIQGTMEWDNLQSPARTVNPIAGF